VYWCPRYLLTSSQPSIVDATLLCAPFASFLFTLNCTVSFSRILQQLNLVYCTIFSFLSVFLIFYPLQNVGDLPLLVMKAGEGQIKQAKQMGGRCVMYSVILYCSITFHVALYCSVLWCCVVYCIAIRCAALQYCTTQWLYFDYLNLFT
jgi:hypothetical protein